MLPQEAKLRNFTYASTMTIDIDIEYTIRNTESMNTPRVIKKTIPKINIGKMPIMLKSSICVLNQNNNFTNSQLTGECIMDSGGYFIIKGSEKTVIGQERAAENRIYCFDVKKNSTKWLWSAEIKSVPDFKCISPKQINMMISPKTSDTDTIYIQIPRIKKPLPIFIVFRALGIISDKDICEKIVLDIDNKKNKKLIQYLKTSIEEANDCLTKEDAIRVIVSNVMFTPINMDKETGIIKKREFAIEVINNDLFPHCKNLDEKIYFLGYMTNKLIKCSLGWTKTDDRDSYINKRIDLTGMLLNNLYRNYFNKLVKDLQKQVVREMNNGSWRSTDDFKNIINNTNIYKIIKSTTIENGIKRSLATGDFGIKQANSNKVGVAQVLNRLTYISSLSHLRRIATPIDKSGKLIPPRKLHNSSWGFLCPAETPEGQSVGVVKNLSYLTHVTTPSDSTPIYNYVLPYVVIFENATKKQIAEETKVFINGNWVGICLNTKELYDDLKSKKSMGILSIYLAIILVLLYLGKFFPVIPMAIINSLIGIIIVVAVFNTVRKLYDMGKRTPNNFDEIDWLWSPNMIFKSGMPSNNKDKYGATNLQDLYKRDCKGANCCDTGTEFDPTTGKCKITTGQESFQNAFPMKSCGRRLPTGSNTTFTGFNQSEIRF